MQARIMPRAPSPASKATNPDAGRELRIPWGIPKDPPAQWPAAVAWSFQESLDVVAVGHEGDHLLDGIRHRLMLQKQHLAAVRFQQYLDAGDAPAGGFHVGFDRFPDGRAQVVHDRSRQIFGERAEAGLGEVPERAQGAFRRGAVFLRPFECHAMIAQHGGHAVEGEQHRLHPEAPDQRHGRIRPAAGENGDRLADRRIGLPQIVVRRAQPAPLVPVVLRVADVLRVEQDERIVLLVPDDGIDPIDVVRSIHEPFRPDGMLAAFHQRAQAADQGVLEQLSHFLPQRAGCVRYGHVECPLFDQGHDALSERNLVPLRVAGPFVAPCAYHLDAGFREAYVQGQLGNQLVRGDVDPVRRRVAQDEDEGRAGPEGNMDFQKNLQHVLEVVGGHQVVGLLAPLFLPRCGEGVHRSGQGFMHRGAHRGNAGKADRAAHRASADLRRGGHDEPVAHLLGDLRPAFVQAPKVRLQAGAVRVVVVVEVRRGCENHVERPGAGVAAEHAGIALHHLMARGRPLAGHDGRDVPHHERASLFELREGIALDFALGELARRDVGPPGPRGRGVAQSGGQRDLEEGPVARAPRLHSGAEHGQPGQIVFGEALVNQVGPSIDGWRGLVHVGRRPLNPHRFLLQPADAVLEVHLRLGDPMDERMGFDADGVHAEELGRKAGGSGSHERVADALPRANAVLAYLGFDQFVRIAGRVGEPPVDRRLQAVLERAVLFGRAHARAPLPAAGLAQCGRFGIHAACGYVHRGADSGFPQTGPAREFPGAAARTLRASLAKDALAEGVACAWGVMVRFPP